MKASSRPPPPSVNYIINHGMNFRGASASLPTPSCRHWQGSPGCRQAGLLACPRAARGAAQLCTSTPRVHSEQPWDTCRAGVLLGKADIHFIALQRQVKDAADVVLQNTAAGAETHLWEVTETGSSRSATASSCCCS